MRIFIANQGKILLVGLILGFLVTACASTTPPAPDLVSAKLENTSYLFLHWKEGLRVMIWFDVAENVSSQGTGSTTDPIHRQFGYATASNGRRVEWQLETADGKTATFSINDQPYALSGGQLFIVRMRNDQTQIQQISHDLSGVQPTNESCQAFGKTDPEVSRFIQETAAAIPTPQSTLVPPTLLQVEPPQVIPGEQVRVIGKDGYLFIPPNGYNESARDFPIYFDNKPIGSISCYVNHCEGKISIPQDAMPGAHQISVEGGSHISLQLVNR
jgi:hypothetical protein